MIDPQQEVRFNREIEETLDNEREDELRRIPFDERESEPCEYCHEPFCLGECQDEIIGD